ncbi:MAG: tRNA uridine-5-carboxymethylaminomethyl(34) synthesis GTPase MnmE [Desulfotomaculales bacterium]
MVVSVLKDTIAAVATPLGEGGIGIVRVSGEKAIEIARQIFFPARESEWWAKGGYRLFYGHVRDPETGEVIDEVLLGVMHSPHSFTREDVVEFNCHGGLVPLRRTLEAVLRQGARLAGPGEFSRRAFLNGRIDLAQAEAVIDLIRAKTDAQGRIAVSQLKGELSRRISFLQEKVADLLAACEAAIDFPEDVEALSREEMLTALQEINQQIEGLLASAEKGRVFREGATVAIIGRPNVGKSSLLNALLRERRAIVTDVPGTTRDVIEEIVNIKGVPVRIADTAGLRATRDPVEKIGVEKAREALRLADLVLVVLDAQDGVTGEDREIIKQAEKKVAIYIVNKIDLVKERGIFRELREISGGRPLLGVSALTGEGVDSLEELIFQEITGSPATGAEGVLVSNVRHRDALRRAHRFIEEACSGAAAGLSEDLLAVDLRRAWEALGEITGTTAAEDIINRIFAGFCVGK